MKITNLEIKGITANSKEVKPGYLFVAIKGSRADGGCFIREAISRGAGVIVVEKKAPPIKFMGAAVFLVVSDCRKFFAQAAHNFYQAPSHKVKVVGITGTNGKTTITYLIEALAKSSGDSCGVIGTINYRFAGKVWSAVNTTPGPQIIQGLLRQMYLKKVKYCALEVSSHALDQERVGGINFRQAIFTNLTQDHLDYHKNFENYFLAKAKLFRGLDKTSYAIINQDDAYALRLKRLTKAKILTYGIKNKSEVMARDIHFGLQKTTFTLIAPGIRLPLEINLVGVHNIYNILAAVSWALTEKLALAKIKAALGNFKNVPGRLERVGTGKNLNIFVDYAHTPDALRNVISALRELVGGKIIVVFGCGGERDKLKRPRMGRIVSQLADYAIITSDNPRSEEPKQIIKEILQGVRKNNYCVLPNRRQAIIRGVALMQADDCLLIAGKGHEDYQIIKNKILPFSDRKVVAECLK